MKILKPQKILFNTLNKSNNFLEETNKSDEISNIELEEYRTENIELNDITIEKSIISYTDIISSNLEKNSFIDVEF